MIAAFVRDETSGPRNLGRADWRIVVALIVANEIRGLIVVAEAVRLAWN